MSSNPNQCVCLCVLCFCVCLFAGIVGNVVKKLRGQFYNLPQRARIVDSILDTQYSTTTTVDYIQHDFVQSIYVLYSTTYDTLQLACDSCVQYQ
jgi:hypothetical protein